MLARAVFAIIVIGLTAAGVLSIRQARLQAAHELTQAKLRAALLSERLAEKRAVIAEATTPQSLLPEPERAVVGTPLGDDGDATFTAASEADE